MTITVQKVVFSFIDVLDQAVDVRKGLLYETFHTL